MINEVLKNEDLLSEIKSEELPELAKLYERHQDWLPHAYNSIITGLDWSRKCKTKLMIFISPRGCWKEDGTFFVYTRCYSNNLSIFSLDRTGKNAIDGVFNTKLLENIKELTNNEDLMFFAIHYTIDPLIQIEFKKRNIKVAFMDTATMFCLRREKVMHFETVCPPGFYVKELHVSSADYINALWPHRYQGSERYIKSLICLSGGYGIFLESTDQLIAWVVFAGMGQLSMLQTLDEFQKRGFGKLILKVASMELAKRGFHALGTVAYGNTASERLFESCGFESIGFCKYISVTF